ncbi:unnamed protein product [Ectocarpus sp. 13 AM-2016]
MASSPTTCRSSDGTLTISVPGYQGADLHACSSRTNPLVCQQWILKQALAYVNVEKYICFRRQINLLTMRTSTTMHLTPKRSACSRPFRIDLYDAQNNTPAHKYHTWCGKTFMCQHESKSKLRVEQIPLKRVLQGQKNPLPRFPSLHYHLSGRRLLCPDKDCTVAVMI